MIGAGPAGLAAAQQLRRAGHTVTVYERDEAGGGLVRFGVPDFKIEKWVVERRLEQLRAEGVQFEYGWMSDRSGSGLTFRAGDVRTAADQVLALRDDPARRAAMGERARRTAEAEFARDELARRYVELFPA